MGVINRLSKFIARGGERGSALLISLMVLVGLSLIGLGYVALSETEGAIAANERNAAQTLHIAEAASLMVVEWFQNPKWARDNGLAPANTDAIKVERVVTRDTGVEVYRGRYKSDSGAVLFDKPYKPLSHDRFFGTENNPDILINDRTAPAFMAAFNIALFNNDPNATGAANCTGCDNNQGGRITEIRIYAPPIDGGFVNQGGGWDTPATSGIPAPTGVGSGFHYGGSRFGLATIRVTAAKFNKPDCGVYVAGCRVISERNVKMVIAEWPFPGPGGPIQSNANIGTTGNYHIHWGKITATQEIDLKRPYVGIPWIDAFVRGGFENGYEAAASPVVATNTTKQWVTDLTSSDRRINRNYLYELVGLSFEDPWYQARARGAIEQMPDATDPHDLRWSALATAANSPACNPCNTGDAKTPGQSNMFQLQTKVEQTDYTNSLFPRVDYDFWKQVAVSADSQDNVYYLSWVSKDIFRDRHGNQRTFRQWVDVKANPPAGTGAKSKPGFYFFDTENKLNPQNNRGGVLTDKVSMSGGNMQMQGFIYLNSEVVDITGLDGYPGYYNMPGEVYRDVGFRKVLNATTYAKRNPMGVDCTALDTSNCVTEGLGDGKFSWQDLDWSNGAGTKNGELDVFVAQGLIDPIRTGAPPVTMYFPVVWYPNCVPGRNGVAGVNCSEPHEPYLNFIYPDPATPLGSITVQWEAPGAETRRRKTNPNAVIPNAALPTCVNATLEDCTSNSWDENGALVRLSPILDGVLYNEGEFGSAGNADYFGSLLFERDVDASGTPNIWFDEKLIKGMWPPGNFGFPRVYITTYEMDQ